MKQVLVLFFICLFGSVHAQTVVLNENFTNNQSYYWWEGSSYNEYSAKVHDGAYWLERFKHDDSNTLVFSKEVLQADADFTIECDITQISGDNDAGFGVLWYSKNIQYTNSFLISSNGYYMINTYEKDKYRFIQPWTATTFVHPKGKANRLKITRTGKKTTFYVNDQELFTTENAIPFFQQYIGFEVNQLIKVKIDNVRVTQGERIIQTIANAPEKVEKINLGKSINTEKRELLPVISPDGKTLYFSRDNTIGEIEQMETDIWYSRRADDGTWSKAIRLGSPLNNTTSNAVVSVSADNNKLVLMNQYDTRGNTKGMGYSISRRRSGGWTTPEDMLIPGFHNNGKYTSACLSASEKIFIVSIVGNETFGEEDLYISILQENGTWSPLRNLGAFINTPGSEITPFLASDDATLYYSTSGKAGYGSSDIFVTKRLDDTWENWSEPLNLGPAINTPGWEAYFVISSADNYVYMISEENTNGLSDIFRLTLPEAAQPDPVILVKGTVYNAKTKQPMAADIRYETLADGDERGMANSDPKTGVYQILLPSGSDYGFHAEAEGFISVNENVELTAVNDYQEITHDLYLVPIEIGQSIQLRNVFFVLAKAEMLPTSYPELDRLVTLLLENPTIEIELGGHTDNQGSAELNQRLSEDRVEAVKNYLVSKGIAANRITGKGYGFSKPVAANDTEANRQLNRRVEFKILKK